MRELISVGLEYSDGKLQVLKQTLLPHHEEWEQIESSGQFVACIKRLDIRGAPLLGVGGAIACAWLAERIGVSSDVFFQQATEIKNARPTAVNLAVGVDRAVFNTPREELTVEKVVKAAEEMADEDRELCKRIGENGAAEIKDGDVIVSHCNAGALATFGIGTSMAVYRTAWEQGKDIQVMVDETRPLLQGARLTAWELMKLGIPYTVISDNMIGHMMQRGEVTKAVVGADRIAMDGGTANKIGTYTLACVASIHGVPFYFAAPYTTVDFNTATGWDIKIEERDPAEVVDLAAPKGSRGRSPAFDMTPAQFVTGGWILDTGVARNPEELLVLAKR